MTKKVPMKNRLDWNPPTFPSRSPMPYIYLLYWSYSLFQGLSEIRDLIVTHLILAYDPRKVRVLKQELLSLNVNIRHFGVII